MKISLIRSVSFILLFAANPLTASAITVYIGDADGFGFTNIVDNVDTKGKPVDKNGNNKLDIGETLPDLDHSGRIAEGENNIDSRSSVELAGQNGEIWTDVALSRLSGGPGLANDAYFTFRFDIPVEGAPDYGKEHFVSIVYADYDVSPMYAMVEGKKVSLQGGKSPADDGQIWRAYAPVAWSDMLDGQVTVKMVAPNEPFVFFDYAILDLEPLSTDQTSCCSCDLTPVLTALEAAKQERAALTEQLTALDEKMDGLMEYLKLRLDTGAVITQKDLAPGQGGVYIMGAQKQGR